MDRIHDVNGTGLHLLDNEISSVLPKIISRHHFCNFFHQYLLVLYKPICGKQMQAEKNG